MSFFLLKSIDFQENFFKKLSVQYDNKKQYLRNCTFLDEYLKSLLKESFQRYALFLCEEKCRKFLISAPLTTELKNLLYNSLLFKQKYICLSMYVSVSKLSIWFLKQVISTKRRNKLLIHNINLTGHRKSACCLRLLIFPETRTLDFPGYNSLANNITQL